MGTAPKPKSTRARKARSAKPSHRTARKGATSSQPTGIFARHPGRPRIPPAIEVALDAQRESLATAVSLLYALHCALRREIEDGTRIESEAMEHAYESADLSDISGTLLVQLDAIHGALDPVELAQADPDPEMVAIAEAARKLMGRDAEGSRP